MCILYVHCENLYLSFIWLIMLRYVVTWHISHFKYILIFYKVLFIVLIKLPNSKLNENVEDVMTCGCITPGIKNIHSNTEAPYLVPLGSFMLATVLEVRLNRHTSSWL